MSNESSSSTAALLAPPAGSDAPIVASPRRSTTATSPSTSSPRPCWSPPPAAPRALRPPGAPPLRPSASLHYGLPVIDELADFPLDPAYLHYLRTRLTPLAPAFLALLDHQLS